MGLTVLPHVMREDDTDISSISVLLQTCFIFITFLSSNNVSDQNFPTETLERGKMTMGTLFFYLLFYVILFYHVFVIFYALRRSLAVLGQKAGKRHWF